MLKNKAKKGLALSSSKGFTLIEVLVVIAIIAILAAIVLVAINPAQRFRDARNSQRRANVESILSAIQQNMVDHNGITTCTLPAAATVIRSTAGGADLSACLSVYLAILPVDPSAAAAHWTTAADYDTGYTVMQVAGTGQVTVAAPQALVAAEGPVPAPGITVTR
ncbi:MAG TPA: prepilin-type N-terminal cleavage/methylation domain-containing protein [Candidatus Paceibacterota bacterium]